MATKKTAKKKVQYWGTGRRKKAIARVRLIPGGEGAIVINKRDITEYFPQDTMEKTLGKEFLRPTQRLVCTKCSIKNRKRHLYHYRIYQE